MIINKKWEKMTFKSQETLREAIFNHIVMKHNEYPKFMISKMIKLLVDIARNDWPLRYPNFIDHIIQVRIVSNIGVPITDICKTVIKYYFLSYL